MKYKGIYDDVDGDILNTIDGNMRKVHDNYWKMARGSYPKKIKASYVNILITCPDTGDKKKHIMGPYSKKIAESIMTERLSCGECCWIEEDWIR